MLVPDIVCFPGGQRGRNWWGCCGGTCGYLCCWILSSVLGCVAQQRGSCILTGRMAGAGMRGPIGSSPGLPGGSRLQQLHGQVGLSRSPLPVLFLHRTVPPKCPPSTHPKQPPPYPPAPSHPSLTFSLPAAGIPSVVHRSPCWCCLPLGCSGHLCNTQHWPWATAPALELDRIGVAHGS